MKPKPIYFNIYNLPQYRYINVKRLSLGCIKIYQDKKQDCMASLCSNNYNHNSYAYIIPFCFKVNQTNINHVIHVDHNKVLIYFLYS